MNRIYNVIWSKAKKCYVVVSELVTSGGGKTKSIHAGASFVRISAVMAIAALMAGINISTVQGAANTAMIIDGIDYSGKVTGKNQQSESSYLYNYKNPGNKAAQDGSGSPTGFYTNNKFSGIAIGENTSIQESGASGFYSGVAIGNYAKATGGVSFAMGNYAQAMAPSAMAIGTATYANGFNSLAMMRQSAATADFATAIGTASWAAGDGSFAMGYSATAKGEQSIAIGAAQTKKLAGQQGGTPSAEYNSDGNTVTEGKRSLAFGTTARTAAGADDSMAFGSKANTSGVNAVAMGNSAQAKAADAFAFGNTAVSSGSGAMAMGKSAQAKGNGSFAMGSSSSSGGVNAIAMGSSSQASSSNSIALGGSAKSLGADALAIGGSSNAAKEGAIALGKDAKANTEKSTAIGLGATVTGKYSMAIGTDALAESNNSLALGTGTQVKGTLVDGKSAFTDETNYNSVTGVVGVGNEGAERRIINVAGGEKDTDATNVKQLKYVNSNLAKSIAGPSYTGYEANGSTYKAPDFNIKNSTYHTVKEAVEAAQTNFFSAKGTSADANYDNKGATGTNATAAGVRASAAGNYGTAVGADATAANTNSTAIGYKAKSGVNDGVALGSNSVASVAAGAAGYNVKTANNRANGYSGLTGAALTSAMGAVSVGDGGTKTRQITNVAAGTADTDAVNVAQLRNVNLKVAGNTNSNGGKNDVLLDNQTLTVKGDGTYITTTANNQTIDVALTDATKKKIDNAADKDLSNITNTGKKNITALGTVVQAGHNVTVGAPAVDATTGQKTYTVNGMDTKVSLGSSGLMTLSGGTPDANGVRSYTVDVDPAKVAKTDLSNITDGGRTVIREEAQKSVKVVAGKNTTVMEGTDGTYKTYKVDVDAPDYQLVENSAAVDKAYTVSGNKVDLTVQDAKNPADKKTVTIKDIASKTELDSTKQDLTNKIDDTKTELNKNITDTKTELNNKITDTRTELINTGLKFNADNNDVKTNKLGSKVTVAGDGSNISTTITQTGDDTTIKVALGQDISVNTVTAAKTVKAGTATMGNQSVTDNKGTAQNGNFVSGLDNKSWSLTDPAVVSGRAATEDQLKTVSDAVKAANASATDYRLIANPNNTADGSYKVDNNKVDLAVKDEKSGTTNTVTIKDIASKTELDKVQDRSVKYDGTAGKDTVTLEGGADGTKITNLKDGTVAAGSKDAVNGGQLHQVKEDLGNTINNTKNELNTNINKAKDEVINKGLRFDANNGGEKTNKLGSKVTVKGDNSNVITTISQDGNGDSTIDVKLGKDLKTETITATGANGKDGKIGINGKDGVTTNISVTRDGKPGVDGAAGTTTTRIVYQKPDGTNEEVATLNDGLKFKGDMGATSNVKLNKQVDITGGVTNAADLATGNNIGVTSAAVDANGNAKLQLQLAKDLTGLKSVTASDIVKAGTATVGKQTVADNKGANQTGNYVTGLDNTSWTISDPVYVPNRAATEEQLKTVSDALKAANASATDYRLIANSDNAQDGSYKVDNNQVDLKVKDEKSGDVKTVTIKDIASKTELDKVQDRSVKYDGTAGKDTVTLEGGADGTKITNLKDGTVAAGSKDAVNGGQLHQVKEDLGNTINNTKNELNTNINKAKDEVINKGLRFDANNGGEKINKLGSKVTVKGDNSNVITTISQDGNGDSTIDVKLGKDLKTETITATGANGKDGKIGINGKDGVTTNISVTRDGKPGVDGAAGTTTTRIVYQKPDGTNEEVATLNDGLKFKGDMGATSNVKLNKQVDITGGVTNAADLATGNNIGVTSAAVDANGNAKLQLQLAKDLTGLKSVTASDTVIAGTAKLGNQTVTKTGGTNETGNYVTGLDNKDWDAGNIVSGRAATEDQLQKALSKQSADSTDYRLIKNQAAGSNGDYTVDANGDVSLTVQDKNHTDKTETVTIKDVASKANVDKLTDRAVKYDLDGSGNPDKAKVTYEGPTYTNKTGGTHVTNLAYATGNDGSEAVNVDYLKDKIKDNEDTLTNKGLKFDANNGGEKTNKLGSKVTVKGEGTAPDADYSGENIKTFITQDAATGNTTIDVKMNKNIIVDTIKVNKNGKDGKDGVSITGPTGAAGQDGNNGKVGITGADGKDAVSISGKDGVGHIGLTGPAGTNGVNGTNGIDMSVKNGYDDATKGIKGEKGVDGVGGITRIVYQDKTGEHQVATMDDGLQFTGNNTGTVNKQKLNSLVKVQGEGVTAAQSGTFTSASGNINVKANGTDTLELQLAKDLKNLDSVTAAKTVKAGDVIMGGQTVNNGAGGSETGNYVTGLDNKDWDADKIVSGRAATEDQLKDALAGQTNTGLNFNANVGGEKTNKLGSTVTVKGEGTAPDADYSGENIKTFITQDAATGNTTIDVKMNKNIIVDTIKVNKNGKDGKDGVSITGPTGAAGQDGNNGKVGITGADGKDAVSISGKDGVGHIGLTGPAGTNGVNGTNGIDMSVKNGYDDAAKGIKGEKGVDGVGGITRIVYQDKTGEHQVATMDDGMIYGGDSGTVIKKKLNNQVNVKGGISDRSKLSDEDNIGVVSDGTDTLMLRLAKDLKGLNSATFNNGTDGVNGKTVVNGEGVTVQDKAGNPLTSVTKDGVKITDGPAMTTTGIDAADKKITNVADGKIETGSKDAVNGGQLADQIKSITDKGFGLTAEDNQSVKKPLGDTVTVKGDGTNIKTSVDNGAVKVELKKDITVDTVTAKTVTTGDTKMDTNGVTIKDGVNEATKLTRDGLQINDGGNKSVTVNKDGLTIENGPKVTKDGIDAADKKITNVADGTIGTGSKDAVNGGQLHTAIEDIKSTGFGLKAEDGQSVKKPLGDTIDLKGDGNIKTSVDNGAIKMSLNDKITLGQDPAKQVKIDGSEGTVTAGNGDKEVKLDGAAGTITAGKGDNQVKIDGTNGSVTANTVKAGDVVVGKQTSDGKEGNFVTGLDNKTWDPENPVAVPGRAATEDQLKAVNDDFNNKARTGRVFQGDQPGDSGKVVRGLGDTMNLTGGADVNRLADNNIGVVKNSAGDGYNIKLAKDLKGLESVTTTDADGNTTVMNGGGMMITPVQGNAVSLTKDGLDNGGNRITNVGPGVDGTDAVNVNQLSSAMRSVDGKIADVGAASAAISGLKPLQYDPLEPTQVLAAVGHYKGSTAAALGVAHYTNESTMFHMGVSLGGHDNMVNAGVSYKFGTSDAKKAVPARYKAGPISSAYVLQDEVTALKAENARMKQRDEELTAKYDQVQRDNEEMKAQIALLMQQAGLTK